MYRANLCFSDGHVETVTVPAGCNVLKAAHQAGVDLASQCESGSCGTCIAQLEGGDAELIPGRGSALLATEYREGGRLLCSTLIQSDTTFELPYPSDVVFGPQPKLYSATVADITELSDSVVALRLEMDTEPLQFQAGQYARIRSPGTSEWRSYSMANRADDGWHLEFHVRILADGIFSSQLGTSCGVGTQLDIQGPYGSFVVSNSKQHQLFVAGGTGLAPMLSMIDYVREHGGRRTPLTLCFACQTEHDLYYTDEIDLRTMWMPKMDARVAVTEPTCDASWRGLIGTPVSLIESADVTDNTTAYLCGPPGMIEGARQHLRDLGLPPDQIHNERFVSSDD